jgi:hypothetical protein
MRFAGRYHNTLIKYSCMRFAGKYYKIKGVVE